jgi:hypothetical protein
MCGVMDMLQSADPGIVRSDGGSVARAPSNLAFAAFFTLIATTISLGPNR